jgi:hypothetical protein
MRKAYFILLLLVIVSCTNEKPKAPNKLSEAQLYKLTSFADFFENKVLEKDYSIFNNYWSDEALIERIGPLSETGKSVFNHYFKEEWGSDVRNSNIDMINLIKHNYGSLYLTNLDSFDSHLEATYALNFNTTQVEFIRYRFELSGAAPIITDRCSLKDNIWLSQRIREIVNASVKYPITSKQRTDTHMSMLKAENSILNQEYQEALNYLNSIPKAFSNNLNTSIRKLECAREINLETYLKTLDYELKENDFEYLKYLNVMSVGDSAVYTNYFNQLMSLVGETPLIDSLYFNTYVW